MEFRLGIPFTLKIRPGSNTLQPLRYDVKIEPSLSVTASLHGYVSVLNLRAGVYGDGHLIRGSLPLTVSYYENRPSNKKACLLLSAELNMLEVEAGIFYQWLKCRLVWFRIKCSWGTRHNLLSFGRMSAITMRRDQLDYCYF